MSVAVDKSSACLPLPDHEMLKFAAQVEADHDGCAKDLNDYVKEPKLCTGVKVRGLDGVKVVCQPQVVLEKVMDSSQVAGAQPGARMGGTPIARARVAPAPRPRASQGALARHDGCASGVLKALAMDISIVRTVSASATARCSWSTPAITASRCSSSPTQCNLWPSNTASTCFRTLLTLLFRASNLDRFVPAERLAPCASMQAERTGLRTV